MAPKIVFFVLALFLVFQVISGAPQQSAAEANASARGLAELVQVAIKNLKDLISYTLNKLNGILNEIVNNASSELQMVSDYVFKTSSEAIKKIKKLKDQAISLNINPDTCISDNLNILDNISQEVVAEITSCQEETIGPFRNIVNDAIDKVNNFADEVNDFNQELDNCGSGIPAFDCMNKFLVKARAKLTELTIAFDSITRQVQSQVTQTSSETTNCAYDEINNTAEKILRIETEVSNCLIEAMENLPKIKSKLID